MTQFSILIPTRDRPATFRHTLSTVVDQSGDDFEIVVADNCGSPATKVIVEEFATRFPRIRYLRSDTILPMSDNWERGLSACQGEYVTVLGDDDALLPSTLTLARNIIAATQSKLISWDPHNYWWPDTIVWWSANRLNIKFGNEFGWGNSRELLRRFYDGTDNFGDLPMIYNAFVHRSVIEQGRQAVGRYFYPAKLAPDITTGIRNLLLTDRFVYSSRPLSLRGISGQSIGTAQWARHLGAERRARYLREERSQLEDLIHPALIPSPSLHLTVISVMLHMKDLFFPDDAELQVNLPNVVREMVRSLNFEPEAYDDNLADAKALAEKLGIRIDPSQIPPKQVRERRPHHGPQSIGGKIAGVTVNCDQAGIFNIADAARLVDSMLEPAR